MAGKGGSRKKKKNSGSIYVTVIVALMLLAAIFGLSVFFNISDINVVGAGMYTDQQVVAASGIELDGSIFFLSQSSAAVKIKDALSYVDEVRIIRDLPGTITIEVTESLPVAALSYEGNYWVIDKNAKILEKTNSQGASKAVKLMGIEPIMPVEGDSLALGDAGAVQLTYLKNVLSGLVKAGIYEDITWLDMRNISSIKFDYMDRFTVDLGTGEDVDDKLWMLEKVVEDRSSNEKGTINVSKLNEGHFVED